MKKSVVTSVLPVIVGFLFPVLTSCFYEIPNLNNPADPLYRTSEENMLQDYIPIDPVPMTQGWILVGKKYGHVICCKTGVEKWEDGTVLPGNYGDNTVYLYNNTFDEFRTHSVAVDIATVEDIFQQSGDYYISGVNSSGDGVVVQYNSAWEHIASHTVKTGDSVYGITERNGSFWVLFGATKEVREFDPDWMYTGTTVTLSLPEVHTELTGLFWHASSGMWVISFRNGHDSGGGLAFYDNGFTYVDSVYRETYDNQGMWFDVESSALEFYSNFHDTIFVVEKE